jgi:hypothetical protein
MFVSLNPLEKRLPPDQFSAAEGDGGNGSAARQTARDRIADMRLRAMQHAGHLRERQEIEIRIGHGVVLMGARTHCPPHAQRAGEAVRMGMLGRFVRAMRVSAMAKHSTADAMSANRMRRSAFRSGPE